MVSHKHEMETTTETENMDNVMAFIEAHTSNIGNPKVSQQLMLVGEELSFNIFSYAYDDGPGPLMLTICHCEEQRKVEMQFRDFGKAYNPLEVATPDLDADISERPIGGLGVMLSKKLTDQQTYDRIEGQNILTVAKHY